MENSHETHRTVLVAEDNIVNRELVSLFLEKRGFEVQVAKNGLQAVQLATARHFDLIIMDVSMPEMDGCAATTLIRQCERDHHSESTPIVALTAHATQEVRNECFDVGMNEVLVKPVRAGEFFRAIDRFVH